VTTVHLDCGHWIQQEQPDETNRVMLEWLRDLEHEC
jgi:pimeloyl-ACP methyl ester carboxylesterase